MTSPSGALGAQFNMGRMPSMGLGNLDSMELPDTVRDDSNAEGVEVVAFNTYQCSTFLRWLPACMSSISLPHPFQSFPSKLRKHLGNGLKTYALLLAGWPAGCQCRGSHAARHAGGRAAVWRIQHAEHISGAARQLSTAAGFLGQRRKRRRQGQCQGRKQHCVSNAGAHCSDGGSRTAMRAVYALHVLVLHRLLNCCILT